MASNSKAHFVSLTIIFSILSSLYLSGIAYAQAQESVSAESAAIKIANLEQAYDSQIYSVLSNYFDRKRFFVDVTIDADVIEESVQTTSTGSSTSNTRNIMMPGLPFLPEENLRSAPGEVGGTGTVINENTLRSLHLNSVRLNIYADTSYTEIDLEFMRFIAGMAAKIDESRGDEITINALPIPQISSAPSTGPQITVVNQPPAQPQGWLENLQLFIPGLALMLLLGLTVLVSRYSGKSKDEKSISPGEFREAVKAQNLTPAYSQNAFDSVNAPANTSTAKETGSSQYDNLVNSFFDRTDEISGIFGYWISSEGWEGAVKAAEVVACVDPQLKRVLKNEMQDEHYKMLDEMLAELAPITLEKRQKTVKQFMELLNSDVQQTFEQKKSGNITLFKFLDHVPEDLLMLLLRSEVPKVSALILSYLSDERAASFLDKMGKEKASGIILEMTATHSMSHKEQSEIASEVFEKAMDLVEKQKEQKTKVENILPILERLPVDAQRDFIEELKQNEPYIGARIEEEFVTIEEIPQINKRILEDALKSLSTEVLLDALVDTNKQIIDAVLSVRPKREQKLIRLELENQDNKEFSNTGAAKAQMMNAIRSAVKRHRGS